MRNVILAALIFLVPTAASAQTLDLTGSAPTEPSFPRVRFGGDAFLAAGTNGEQFSVAVQTHLRLGAQLDDQWALYYQAGGYFGGAFVFSLWSGDSYDKAIYMHTSSAMAEVTFGSLFQIAVGPSLAAGVIGRRNGMATEVGGGGSFRAAFVFGARGREEPRTAFSLGVQTDVDYLSSGNLFWMAGLTFGFELF